MRIYAGFLVSFAVIFSAGIMPTHAQTLSASSDILGLRPDMSREDLKKAVESSMTVSDFDEKKETIGTADYTAKDVLVQYRFIITPQSEDEANAAQVDKEKKRGSGFEGCGVHLPVEPPHRAGQGSRCPGRVLRPERRLFRDPGHRKNALVRACGSSVVQGLDGLDHAEIRPADLYRWPWIPLVEHVQEWHTASGHGLLIRRK